MTALNKLLKRPRRAAAGIWRATETASWSSESMAWIQREKFDDTGAERCSINISFPACYQREFVLVRKRDGLSRLPGLGLPFWVILSTCWDILVQHFLPMDFLAGIAVLRACARFCGCRAGICLNPRGGCNQMRIRLCCLCISGATFLIESTCSVIPHQAFDYTSYPTSLVRCWVPF